MIETITMAQCLKASAVLMAVSAIFGFAAGYLVGAMKVYKDWLQHEYEELGKLEKLISGRRDR